MGPGASSRTYLTGDIHGMKQIQYEYDTWTFVWTWKNSTFQQAVPYKNRSWCNNATPRHSDWPAPSRPAQNNIDPSVLESLSGLSKYFLTEDWSAVQTLVVSVVQNSIEEPCAKPGGACKNVSEWFRMNVLLIKSWNENAGNGLTRFYNSVSGICIFGMCEDQSMLNAIRNSVAAKMKEAFILQLLVVLQVLQAGASSKRKL